MACGEQKCEARDKEKGRVGRGTAVRNCVYNIIEDLS